MDIPWILLGYYTIFINIFTMCAFGLDKRKAVKRSDFRLPEALLLGLSICGGVLGAISGMWIFRHKTSKTFFKLKVYIIMLAYLCLVVYLLFRTNFLLEFFSLYQ